MANPTKLELSTMLSAAFDAKTSSTVSLTDAELSDCFNTALTVFKTVNPEKGTPTIKNQVVFE